MNFNYIDSKLNVENFLQELHNIINSKDFIVETDLDIILKKKNENISDQYTTQNTLLQLNYDKYDIKNTLLSLTYKEYIETGADRFNNLLPKVYVFCKTIQGKQIYIKIKIRDKINHKVLCLSFHFARYPIIYFPYSNI